MKNKIVSFLIGFCAIFGDSFIVKAQGACSPVLPAKSSKSLEISKVLPFSPGEDTLEKVLGEIYLTNPDLEAARAQLRVTDESVASATAAWLPSIELSASDNRSRSGDDDDPLGTSISKTKNIGVNLSQNIYAGGATVAGIERAEVTVLAQRAGLISAEQGTLFSGIKVYLDLIAQAANVEVLRNSEKTYFKLLDQARARFDVGEGTMTDVAFAEAKAADAGTRKIAAESALETARGTFLQLVGRPPQKLAPPKMLYPIPKTRREALKVASKMNPNLITAIYNERSARYAVNIATASFLPRINLTAGRSRSRATGLRDFPNGQPPTTSTFRQGSSANVGISLSMPLYSAPLFPAVRSAIQSAGAARIQIESNRRNAAQTVTAAWESLIAARVAVENSDLQVKALQLSLEGVRQEYSVGTKNIIDVAQVEDQLLSAQLQLINSQIQEMLSGYQLLQAMGYLTAPKLRLPVPYYNPEAYYDAVRDNWFTFGGWEWGRRYNAIDGAYE